MLLKRKITLAMLAVFLPLLLVCVVASEDDLSVHAVDTNDDGKPDWWFYSLPGGNVVRRESDANHDGTVDGWLFFDDEKGLDFFEDVDMDFDGVVDTIALHLYDKSGVHTRLIVLKLQDKEKNLFAIAEDQGWKRIGIAEDFVAHRQTSRTILLGTALALALLLVWVVIRRQNKTARAYRR